MLTIGSNHWTQALKPAFLAFAVCGLCSCSTTSSVTELRAFAEEHRYETVIPHYMGSKDGYHYINYTYRVFRIPESQLAIEKPFPLTKDSKKWAVLPLP